MITLIFWYAIDTSYSIIVATLFTGGVGDFVSIWDHANSMFGDVSFLALPVCLLARCFVDVAILSLLKDCLY